MNQRKNNNVSTHKLIISLQNNLKNMSCFGTDDRPFVQAIHLFNIFKAYFESDSRSFINLYSDLYVDNL